MLLSNMRPSSMLVMRVNHERRFRPVIMALTRFSLCTKLEKRTPKPCKMTRPTVRLANASWTCPFRKSYPDVLMMQSGQDRNGDNDAGPLNCSMQGRIFL